MINRTDWGSGDPLPARPATWTLPIPPGDLELSCTLNGDPGRGGVAQVEITDPDGYWRAESVEDFGCEGRGGIPSWKLGPGEGSSREEAVEALLTEFAEGGPGPRMTARAVDVGYVAAPTQTWIASRAGVAYVSVDVTETGAGFSAMPDVLC